MKYIKRILIVVRQRYRKAVNSLYSLPVVYNQLLRFLHRSEDKSIGHLQNAVYGLIHNRVVAYAPNVIYEAEHFLNNEYSILGSDLIRVEDNKWNVDFKTAYRWEPGLFYLKYKTVDYNTQSDVKFPWDMSRCHHMLILGEAFLMTRDEKYAKKIIEDIISWIKYNPFLYSINWTCAMDVGIRSVNWMYSISLIKDSKLLDDSFWKLLYNSFNEHRFFIEHNLEKGDKHSGNHYFADVCSLLHLYNILGVSGGKWRKMVNEFEYEVKDQILPSGFHYEKSTSYHRLVLEMLFYTTLMLRDQKYDNLVVNERLSQMFHFLDTIIQTDGSVPLIGDNDNGRFLPFSSKDLLDYRYLISVASLLYPEEQFCNVLEAPVIEACLFFENSHDVNDCDKRVDLGTIFYPDSSFCILRNNKSSLLIHNNPVSKHIPNNYQNGFYNSHTHFDMLSFVFSMNGEHIIIDPGTYCYTSSAQLRNKFRSTEMHNTVMVDRKEQQRADAKSMFKIQQYSFPEKTFLDSHGDFVGSYNFIRNNVVEYKHTRRVSLYDKNCCISDEVTGCKDSSVVSFLHLAQGVIISRIEESKVFLKTHNERTIEIDVHADYPVLIKKEQGYVCPSYGIIQESEVLAFDFGKVSEKIQVKTNISLT